MATATAAAAEAKMTTAELMARLRRHYLKPGDLLPGGAFVPEVTYGRAGGKRCDAVHVGFTSTSGRILTGHEIKVSRSDWRRELDDPDKAEVWAAACHAWYVVAPSEQVVPAQELPPGWGLLVVNPRSRTRLHCVVRAAVNLAHVPPWEAVLSVLARQDTMRAQAIVDERAKARVDARVEVAAELAKVGGAPGDGIALAHAQAEIEQLRTALAAYEEALGVRLRHGSRWQRSDADVSLADIERVGEALKAHAAITDAVKSVANRYNVQHLEQLAGQLREVAAAARQLASLTQGGL